MGDIQELIQQVGDVSNPAKRTEAYNALKSLGESAVASLITALDDTDEDVQQQVANVLAGIGDARAVPALVRLAKDSSTKVSNAAIASLSTFAADTGVGEALRGLTRDLENDFKVRINAMFAFERVSGKTAANQLRIDLLNDPSDPMVTNAASQLGDSRDADAVEPLIAALNRLGDTSPAFSLIVAALGKLGDKRAFEPISAYLNTPDIQKRVQVVDALGKLGDSRAIQLLTPLKGNRDVVWPNEQGKSKITVGDVAHEAIAAIHKINGTETEHEKPWWKIW